MFMKYKLGLFICYLAYSLAAIQSVPVINEDKESSAILENTEMREANNIKTLNEILGINKIKSFFEKKITRNETRQQSDMSGQPPNSKPSSLAPENKNGTPILLPKENIPASKSFEGSKPIEKPNIDKLNKPVEKPEFDGQGKPIENPEFGRPNRPIEKPNIDPENKPFEFDGPDKPIGKSEFTNQNKTIEKPEFGKQNKPIEKPEFDGQNKPIEKPVFDGENEDVVDNESFPDVKPEGVLPVPPQDKPKQEKPEGVLPVPPQDKPKQEKPEGVLPVPPQDKPHFGNGKYSGVKDGPIDRPLPNSKSGDGDYFDNSNMFNDADKFDMSKNEGLDPLKDQSSFPVAYGKMSDDKNSHFFAYFLTLMVMAIFFYLLFHNKQRIFALIIEGRGERSRRRSNRAKYHKLDNNLEEAMSNTKGSSTSLNQVY